MPDHRIKPQAPYNRVSHIVGIVVAFGANIVTLIFFYALTRLQLIPGKYLYAIGGLIIVINLIIDLALIFTRRRPTKPKKGLRAAGYILSVLLLFCLGTGIYYYGTVTGTLNKVSQKRQQKITLSVIAKANDPASTKTDLLGQTVAAVIPSDQGMNELQLALVGSGANQIREEVGYPQLVDNLYKGKNRFILLNEAFRSTIQGTHHDFSTATKVIYKVEVQIGAKFSGKAIPAVRLSDEEKAKLPKQETIKSYQSVPTDGTKPFVLYISGNDDYGPISNVSRSDVNILLTVNPQTHQLLMVTVPRDSYVPIAGGGGGYKDKLTHSGIYGIQSSLDTLANLFEMNINTYARVNFTSLINLVDAVGGITVDNPVAFSSSGGVPFAQGNIHLNGQEALAFARERYNLEGGDFDRGRNQERVIEGLFKEMIQPSNLARFQSIMDAVGNGIDTNLSAQAMATLVRNQLNAGAQWQIVKDSVAAQGETGLPSYAMPGYDLYMAVIDEDSLAEVKADMLRVLGN